MPNIFDKQAQAEAPPIDESMAPPIDEPDEGGPDETDPEYLKALDLAQTKLFEEGGDVKIADTIAKASDLATGLSEQAQALLTMVDEATGSAVPDEMYMGLGLELLSDLVDVCRAAGMPVNGAVVANSTQQFITGVVESLGGDTTMVKQAMSQIDPNELGSALDQSGAQPTGA